MDINLNFDKNTFLSDWWSIMRTNLMNIKSYSENTRAVADNAVTPQELEAYIAEFAQSSPEFAQAVRVFNDLYESYGSSIDAMNSVYGTRLPMYTESGTADADELLGEDSAIYFCSYASENTPTEGTGILINFCETSQLWFAENMMYYREADGDWTAVSDVALNEISDLNDSIESKSEVDFGVYTGNGAQTRYIELGYTPVAVEIYMQGYKQYDFDNATMELYGGLAFTGNPTDNIIEVSDNGFTVHHKTNLISANKQNEKYYFKAYKNCNVIEVE